MSNIATLAPLKLALRNSDRSSIGSRWRCSRTTKTASATAATAKSERTPAEQRADREREGRDAGPDPDRRPALARWERRRDDRERRRVHQRGADALHGARGDERAGTARQAAPQRRPGEDHQSDDEDGATS